MHYCLTHSHSWKPPNIRLQKVNHMSSNEDRSSDRIIHNHYVIQNYYNLEVNRGQISLAAEPAEQYTVDSTDNSTLMKYHWNDAIFVNQFTAGLLDLHDIGWTIKDLSITDGQDPQRKNKIGDTVNHRPDRHVSFYVGRKGSSTVANWFTRKVPANRTTFNHDPDKLNFAFLIDLTLTLSWPEYFIGRFDVKFENIMVAQGHDVTTNNWWFGGINCSNTAYNTVSCAGMASGIPVKAWFVRGGLGGVIGNPHDQFWLVHIQPDVLHAWSEHPQWNKEKNVEDLSRTLKKHYEEKELATFGVDFPR